MFPIHPPPPNPNTHPQEKKKRKKGCVLMGAWTSCLCLNVITLCTSMMSQLTPHVLIITSVKMTITTISVFTQRWTLGYLHTFSRGDSYSNIGLFQDHCSYALVPHSWQNNKQFGNSFERYHRYVYSCPRSPTTTTSFIQTRWVLKLI